MYQFKRAFLLIGLALFSLIIYATKFDSKHTPRDLADVNSGASGSFVHTIKRVDKQLRTIELGNFIFGGKKKVFFEFRMTADFSLHFINEDDNLSPQNITNEIK